MLILTTRQLDNALAAIKKHGWSRELFEELAKRDRQ
jgi:hypothetical protein